MRIRIPYEIWLKPSNGHTGIINEDTVREKQQQILPRSCQVVPTLTGVVAAGPLAAAVPSKPGSG